MYVGVYDELLLLLLLCVEWDVKLYSLCDCEQIRYVEKLLL